MARRRGNGRQRVLMQKMPKKSARQVTFSKRRSSLMKKASELCTLCAAEVLIVVFSPGGKVFSFGHPSTKSIIHRFLGEEPEPDSQTQEIAQAHRNLNQSNLNFHLTQLERLVDAEKKKRGATDQMAKETEGRVWWEQPMERMNFEQLEKFMEIAVMYIDGMKEQVRLFQQEQMELNRGVPPDATGNTTHGGPVLDPKGKGPADEFTSSQALDPMIVGLNDGVPYNPMVTGSSSWALIDPRIHGLNGGISFDPMPGGSRSQPPLDPRTHRLIGGMQFDPMASGSSSQTSLDPMTPGFYGGLPYEPMTAGASGAVPYNQMAMGSHGGVPYNQMAMGSHGGLPYNPIPLRFQARALGDPNAPGPSNGGVGASFDAGASDDVMPYGPNQPYGRGFH